MKAFVYHEYGSADKLRLETVETPVPKDDEVLIKIRAVSINGSDWEGLTGDPLYARMGGLRRPSNKILGSDIAGRVAAVGKDVQQFKPGDAVFGELYGYHGGFAEYATAREKRLLPQPPNLTFEQTACIPQGAVIALQGMRDEGKVQPGQSVLINGAGGSAGMFAVQLAKHYGAEVTGVDNTGKLDFLRSLGADHVVDYTRQDFTKLGKQYDLILDVIAHRSAFAYLRALKPGGRYYAVGGSVGSMLQIALLGPVIRRATGKHVRVLVVRPNREDLAFVTGLCEAGTITPVIDRVFPFSATPDALRYVGERRAHGKVVIAMDEGENT